MTFNKITQKEHDEMVRRMSVPAPVLSAEERQAKIDESLARLRAMATGKPVVKAVVAVAPMAVKLVQKDWADADRGMPNYLIRSPLFGVGDRKSFSKITVIGKYGDVQISYSGEGLLQDDADVWLLLVHISMQQDDVKNIVEFSANSFLKRLGRVSCGGLDHERLKLDFNRLLGSVIEIGDLNAKRFYAGTLIQEIMRDEITMHYTIKLNEKLVDLFASGYTLINNDQRILLGKNGLAKWLHAFYCSHAKPYEYKVQTLHHMCGSDAPVRNFKVKLKAALTRLVNIKGIKSWSMFGDLVAVVVFPSDSQIKHLERKNNKKLGFREQWNVKHG